MTPPRWPGSTDGVGTIIACGVGVAVGGTAVGGTAVAGTRVAGTRVAIAVAGVEVDSIIAGGVGVRLGEPPSRELASRWGREWRWGPLRRTQQQPMPGSLLQ